MPSVPLRCAVLAVLSLGCVQDPVSLGDGPIACGEGTVLVGNECRGAGGGNSSSTSCGAHTEASGNSCVVAPSACGPGLVLKDGTCQVPSPDPDVSAFLGATLNSAGNAKVYQYPSGTLSHHLRHAWTDLPLKDAKAWATGDVPLIGSGMALHLVLSEISSASLGTKSSITFSHALTNLTGPDGSCIENLTPTGKNDVLQLAVYRWSAGEPVAVACAKAGSVTIRHTRYTDEVDLIAILGDGTEIRSTFTESISN